MWIYFKIRSRDTQVSSAVLEVAVSILLVWSPKLTTNFIKLLDFGISNTSLIYPTRISILAKFSKEISSFTGFKINLSIIAPFNIYKMDNEIYN